MAGRKRKEGKKVIRGGGWFPVLWGFCKHSLEKRARGNANNQGKKGKKESAVADRRDVIGKRATKKKKGCTKKKEKRS